MPIYAKVNNFAADGLWEGAMAPLATAALGDPAGVLVADETGVLKEGHLPEGVAARRNRRDPAKEAYDLVFAPAGTTFAELDGVSGLTLDRRRGI